MSQGYGRDLARVHHEGFGDVPTAAAHTLVRALPRSLSGGLFVELGCGSGIVSQIMFDAGFEVLGVDQSAEMLRLARTNVPGGKFVHGSAFDAEIPPCVAVAAVGEVLCYRFDPRGNLPTLGRVFRRVFRALEPGGVFLFDISSPGRGGPEGTFVRWREGPDWSIVSRTTESSGRLLREMSVFVRRGKTYRRTDESHMLNLYPPERIVQALTRTGFVTRHLGGYGSIRIPGWHVFLARKPAG